MKKIINTSLIFLLLTPFTSLVALEPLSGDELGNVTAQGGVYLTGDLTINENGGPLNVDGPSIWQKSCSPTSSDARCGARLALNGGDESGGWLVLDNIRGRFSFEGLTLRTRKINSGFNGDGAAFNEDVLELGLPNRIEFEELKFTVANSNAARPTESGFQQSNIFTVNVNGFSNQQGNLLLFPTGAP
ncbi:hypothetical protein [Bacterioplanoides sp.]|uniref:hypothetical protein n=1 Tax=Bacterioplanoides sp. TaxID=2066072 RepID=UPI003B5980E9